MESCLAIQDLIFAKNVTITSETSLLNSYLKEIPVDIFTGGGELLLLGSGQQLINVLHAASL